MARIAVDAMGGDHAPEQIVLGAIDAHHSGHDLVLVGDQDRLRPVLEAEGSDIPVRHCAELIRMEDDTSVAIREKKDASIAVAARMVASGECEGLVSAGPTGATLAAAAFLIGRLPEVARPAIASIFPTGHVVIDIGANLECKPEHLLQFGAMGEALAKVYLGVEEPKVGLLNIGEEPGKGRELEKEAFRLMGNASFAFVGNVEGRDLATDRAQVIVTDGFTGNILLKVAEGIAGMIMKSVSKIFSVHPEAMASTGAALADLADSVDPESHGGAHLVGTKGVVVIAHGSSSRVAVANAISMASDGVSGGLVDLVAGGIHR